MRVSQVRVGQIHFTWTKSDKNRSVPVDVNLLNELAAHLQEVKVLNPLRTANQQTTN